MNNESCIQTIELLRKLALNIHGIIDVIDDRNCNDIIAMLKEQDAIQPKKESDGEPEPWTTWWYVCGSCGKAIDVYDAYCCCCGRAVKWE